MQDGKEYWQKQKLAQNDKTNKQTKQDVQTQVKL